MKFNLKTTNAWLDGDMIWRYHRNKYRKTNFGIDIFIDLLNK